MEEGFPRGGRKKPSEDATPGTAVDKSSKLKKRKTLSEAEKKKAQFLKMDKKLELPAIGFETLVEGTLCLGCVRKVHDSSLLIGLPGMTTGTVDLRSISTPYSQVLDKLEKEDVDDDEVIYPLESMFRPGDIVVVKVMSVVLNDEGKHRVSLSLNPSDIHYNYMATDLVENIVMTGAVKSKEDKGYIIDLGIKGVSAFLPINSAALTEKKLGKPLGIGQLLSLSIVKCDIKRLMAKVTLNSVPSKVKQVVAPEGVAVKILPGMKVSCIVIEKRASGLMVNFLDSIGRIHNDHLAEKHRADVGDTVLGRVLFIPPWDVGPYMSLDEVSTFPYSCDEGQSLLALKEGDSRRRRGFVTALESRGAKIKLHGGGFALLKRQRASDAMDYTDDKFKADFKVKSEHDLRILEYSPLDKIFIVSAQEHLLDPNNVIAKDELKPGAAHKVSIVSYNSGGAIVKVGDVKGFIPYLHFKDKTFHASVIQKKYPTGSKLGVIVFYVDTTKNSVIFSAKKTLKSSTGVAASSYSDLQVGSTGHGIVKAIAPNNAGIRIQMIGGLLGFAPNRKVPAGPDSTIPLADRFPVGLPVEFKVIEVNEEKKRAILTLDLDFEISTKQGKSKSNSRSVNVNVSNAGKESSSKRKIEKPAASADGKKNKKRKTQEADKEASDEEEIPTLIQISDQTRKRKNVDEHESGKVSKKKKPSQGTTTTMAEQSSVPVVESQSASKQDKLSKKKERKLKQAEQGDAEAAQTKRESEDSGIEDETPALKLPTKSFWDVVFPQKNLNSHDSESEVESEAHVNEESEENVNEKTNPKKQNGLASKQPKKVNQGDKMSEQEHELALIQNSGDLKAWKAYKDFALKSGDPGKAVSMIKRMKDKIPFRDEKGKLHCWMMILQIETQYGTENSVKSTLDEAMKVNDPIAVLDRVAQFYEAVDKINEAEEVLRRRLKMQIHQPDSWINLGFFLYKQGKIEAARSLLPSALQQLSESNQIYVTAKFAKMETEHGDIEKGRSMFLTICLQRPKRADLWLLYANSLYKMKQFQLAGDALRTALKTKGLTPRDCKPLLKRLMEIEKLHGTAESLQKLKSEAAEYLKLS